jgi:hypothetical protein
VERIFSKDIAKIGGVKIKSLRNFLRLFIFIALTTLVAPLSRNPRFLALDYKLFPPREGRKRRPSRPHPSAVEQAKIKIP